MSTQSLVTSIKDVTKKDTSKGEVFIVATSDGTEFTTFQGALANQAYALKGQQVELHYSEKFVTKPDGRSFTNRYYERATPAGQLAIGQVAFGNAPAVPAAPAFAAAPVVAASSPDAREIKIMRQTATKVGALLLGYLPTEERTPAGLLAIADYLVDYYEHGQPANAPLSHDPGPAAAPAHTDNDIPF